MMKMMHFAEASEEQRYRIVELEGLRDMLEQELHDKDGE